MVDSMRSERVERKWEVIEQPYLDQGMDAEFMREISLLILAARRKIMEAAKRGDDLAVKRAFREFLLFGAASGVKMRSEIECMAYLNQMENVNDNRHPGIPTSVLAIKKPEKVKRV